MSDSAPVLLLTRPARSDTGEGDDPDQAPGVLRLPLIELQTAPLDTALQKRLDAVRKADLLIFVSSAAVEATHSLAPRLRGKDDARWYAVGPTTARRVQALFQTDVIQPPTDAAHSEGLLALLPQVNGLVCALFVAPDGRSLLADTLRQRGAQVELIEVYRRQLADLSATAMAPLRRQRKRLVISATSVQLLYAVVALLQKLDWPMTMTPLVVSAPRIESAARALGFVDVRLARSAALTHLLEAVNAPPAR